MQILNRKLDREATFVPSSIDEATRTAVVCWTTGQRVLRASWLKEPYMEELCVDPKSVDLTRLNAGAPLLNSHRNESLHDHIGVVESAWLEGNKGYAKIKFSRRPDVEHIYQDIKDGVLRNISVGYRVHKAEEQEGEEKNIKILRVTRWEPLELSIVSIPADAGATIRKEEDMITEKQVLEKQTTESIRTIELERIREISRLCQKFQLPKEKVDNFIQQGIALDSVRADVLSIVAERSAAHTIPRVTTIRDERDTTKQGITGAILHRVDHKSSLDENASRFRNMSLCDMASTIVGGPRSSRDEIITRAFHSTSDFPEILGNVARQKLLSSYELLAQHQDFWPLVRVRPVPDFKPVRTVRMGEMPSLKKLEEGAEYTYETLGETADQYKIASYGAAIGISRQMILNDDLGALDKIGSWGGSISRLESSLFWDNINSNVLFSDGKPFFSKEHKNIAAKQSDLNIQSLSEARIAMARQQGLDKRDDECLGTKPVFLIVPVELQTQAEQIVSRETTPNQPDQVNPFKGALTVISTTWLKDPKAWYLAGSSAQGADLIEMAYLDGIQIPHVEWCTDFNTDSLKVKARFDVGSKAVDYRGFYKGVCS